jgi:hypothetical protein
MYVCMYVNIHVCDVIYVCTYIKLEGQHSHVTDGEVLLPKGICFERDDCLVLLAIL